MQNEKKDISELLKTYLDTEQVVIYDKACASFKLYIPAGKNDPNARVFAANNIQFQDELNQVKAYLGFLLSRKKADVFQKEHELKNLAREEGYKTAGDRETYCYTDSTYVAYRLELDSIQLLYDRMNSLEWSLKSVLNFI
jgi:hypothetical protein